MAIDARGGEGKRGAGRFEAEAVELGKTPSLGVFKLLIILNHDLYVVEIAGHYITGSVLVLAVPHYFDDRRAVGPGVNAVFFQCLYGDIVPINKPRGAIVRAAGGADHLPVFIIIKIRDTINGRRNGFGWCINCL